jgi:hypothetical protein
MTATPLSREPGRSKVSRPRLNAALHPSHNAGKDDDQARRHLKVLYPDRDNEQSIALTPDPATLRGDLRALDRLGGGAQ